MSFPTRTAVTLQWAHDGAHYSANLVKYTDANTAQRAGKAPGIWYVEYFIVTNQR